MAITVELISPASGFISTDSTPDLQAKYNDPDFSGYITFELDITTSFNSPRKLTQVVSNLVDQQIAIWTTPELTDGIWYWRAQATNTNNDYSGWSVAWMIDENLGAYKRVLAVYENIAKLDVFTQKRVLSIYENIAKTDIWTGTRAYYGYENITSDPPFPLIERLSSSRVPRGSVLTIYGNGFGAKPDNDPANADRTLRGYGGFVYLGTQLCSVISWSWQQIVCQIPQESESGAIKVVLTAPVESGTRESNRIGIEILESEPASNVGLELFICDKSNPNTILCQLDGARTKSFQTLLNNAGSGRFSISRADPKGGDPAILADQNFVLCRLDGVDVFKWIIEGVRPNYVDDSEQQLIEVSGRGVLSLLDRAVVYPEEMPHPTSLERVFTDMHGGAILRMLILEAQQRGCLPGVVIDWEADQDSIGTPFEDLTTVSFHAGTPLTQVISKLSDGFGLFDLEMTPNLHLKLYKVKGEDLSQKIIYRPGQAILRTQKQSDSTKMTNALLVEGENGALVETTHPTGQASWGRREGYLQARNMADDWAKLQDYGQLYLKSAAEVNWGIQGTVLSFVNSKGQRMKPLESFLLGDWIGWNIPPEGSDTTGFSESVRVKGISCEEAENGLLTYTLDLNNVLLEHDIRMNQMVERMAMFTQNSPLSAQSTQTPANKDHNHSHAALNGLSADDHPQYFNSDRHAADTHSSLIRVNGIKISGADLLSGEVTFQAGTNVSLAQDNDAKKIIITASGGSGGGSIYDHPIDEPPAIPHAMDDEFDDTSVNPKWSWINQGAATWTEQDGHGQITLLSGSDHTRLLVQPVPSGDFSVIAKVELVTPLNDYFNFGPVLYNSANNKHVIGGLCGRAYYNGAHVLKMSTTTGFYSNALVRAFPGDVAYMRIRLVGTTYYVDRSLDGVTWINLFSETISTFLVALSHIGIGYFRNNTIGGTYYGKCHWFRVTQ